MILLIDNYDSFSYNLYQLVGSIDPDIRVERNDTLNIDDIRQLKPSHIILSPGPGRPADAGICEDVSMSAPTTVCEINNGNYRSYVIQPEDFGLKRCTKDELVGGTAEENAVITKGILSSQIQGAKRDAVCMNAGAAMKKLEEFVEFSNKR